MNVLKPGDDFKNTISDFFDLENGRMWKVHQPPLSSDEILSFENGLYYNVLIGSYVESRVLEYFGEDSGFMLLDRPYYSHLLAAFNLFPSIGEAKRNGYFKPIPNGISDYKFKDHRFDIMNFMDE